MAPLCKKMKMTGKKGDTIHVPMPIRGDVSAKVAETEVNIQANVEEELIITIDRHFEYSRFIEDIAEIQALNSQRSFYTSDAGYALARRVDTDLCRLATGWGDGTKDLNPGVDGAAWVHSHCFYVPAGAGANDLDPYAPDTVTPADQFDDDAFRSLIQILDDKDVPMDSRYFVIPPAMRKAIMGIDRYVSSDFTSSSDIQSGKIGQLYGVDIYVSTNCPVIESTAENGSATPVEVRGALLFHKETNILAEQLAVRSQTQYKQERLSTLFTADTVYGCEIYRPDSGVVLAVPAR